MVVFGSGGHTAEMIRMIRCLKDNKYAPFYFITGQTDMTTHDSVIAARLPFIHHARWFTVPRSREVKQSWLSTIFTTLFSCIHSFVIVFSTRPELVLVNGPGTCVPICIAAFCCNFCGLSSSTIVFTESFCRVKSLSLTGKLLYPICDRFVVQWPELCDKYERAEYIGQIC